MDHKTLQVNGLNIHYTLTGAGPDIIFLHGWASSARMWSGVVPHLADEYRCWALDLPGCGDSDKPAPSWYSIPHFTAMVMEFARLNELSALRLVGHSMGGMIVLDLAARHPQALERLAAVNPVVTGHANLRPFARPAYARQVLRWILRFSPAVMQPLLAHPLGNRVTGLHHIRRRTEEFSKGTAESLLSSGRAIVGYDVSPVLHRITAPTLILVGDRDVNVPMSESRLAVRRIPNARLQVMHAGHMLSDDRPLEMVQHLKRFLA